MMSLRKWPAFNPPGNSGTLGVRAEPVWLRIPVTVPVEDAVISERPKKEHHGHKDNKEPDQK